MKSNLSRLFFVAALALGLSACEFGDPLEEFVLRLDVKDVPVEVPSGAAGITLEANKVSTTGPALVTNDLGIGEVEQIDAIEIQPSFLSFVPSPAAGKTGAANGTGTVRVALRLGEVYLGPVAVAIENNVVVSVSPQTIAFDGEVADVTDFAAVEAMINRLPEEQRPDLPANWDSMSIDELRAALAEELSQEQFTWQLFVDVTGDLSGDLVINQFEIDGRVAQPANE